jgi:hypothetical protein
MEGLWQSFFFACNVKKFPEINFALKNLVLWASSEFFGSA